MIDDELLQWLAIGILYIWFGCRLLLRFHGGIERITKELEKYFEQKKLLDEIVKEIKNDKRRQD